MAGLKHVNCGFNQLGVKKNKAIVEPMDRESTSRYPGDLNEEVIDGNRGKGLGIK